MSSLLLLVNIGKNPYDIFQEIFSFLAQSCTKKGRKWCEAPKLKFTIESEHIGKELMKRRENIYQLQEHWQFIIIFLNWISSLFFPSWIYSPPPQGRLGALLAKYLTVYTLEYVRGKVRRAFYIRLQFVIVKFTVCLLTNF